MRGNKTQAKGQQKLRIIGGQWRSRQLSFPSVPGLRPTGDRIRETLFNWLAADVPGARCLDLFAGSGALSFEALSRGAASCTALERHPDAVRQLTDNKALLKADSLSVIEADCQQYLHQKAPDKGYHIVFIDPPFDAQLQGDICATINNSAWLAPGATIYCELPATDSGFVAPRNWEQRQQKVAGDVKYCLYSYIEPRD
ncbi:MAG: 16S rRNA (guanine(966)-N(2))-methyltransferase RsmD [Porticoccaceae bacterium]|nr:16S rRNA (guanine(966)-N(2))-methyltransferase RsmD [Porticoccaceae bacterium]MDG1311527.1 16S rRNA (guanine(966)-N(2))-methyltransferase RsmD [Porticoccaceae bacterium]